jgi:hypothetical protein
MYLRELSCLRKGSPVPQKTATSRLSGNRERVAHFARMIAAANSPILKRHDLSFAAHRNSA